MDRSLEQTEITPGLRQEHSRRLTIGFKTPSIFFPCYPDTMSSFPFDESIAAIRALVPTELSSPKIGIVCGSGLSTLARSFKNKIEVPYSGLPGFVESTVAGHKSAFAFGRLGEGEGVPVVAMLGRVRFCLFIGSDSNGGVSFTRTKDIH